MFFVVLKVIIYRDGVSDGQLNVVVDHELKQIMETFPKIQTGYDPKLAFVIVKKRGNARFFQQEGRNIQNPYPGTVIDHTVTNVKYSIIRSFDKRNSFRLIGTIFISFLNVLVKEQFHRHITSKSFILNHNTRELYADCHFSVIWDRSSYSVERMQQITFKL